MMGNQSFSFIALSAILVSILLSSSSSVSAQLSTDFYKNSCPNVESLVRSAVTKKFQQTFVTAPATLRLFFHDCFVRGCDASLLLATSHPEKDHPDDISLSGDGFDTVIKAKAAVDSDPPCRNKVSCADILALATRDVVALAGGPSYQVELGRRDGRISTIVSVQRRLPHPDFNLDQLNNMFASQSQPDRYDRIISKFSKRIHRFTKQRSIDPSSNLQYAFQLRQMCPINVDQRISINMDPTTPQKFDNVYYQNFQQGKGLFSSDQIRFSDTRSRPTVNLFPSNKAAFEQAFVSAITKLGQLGVKTGNQGEIRRDCSRVN